MLGNLQLLIAAPALNVQLLLDGILIGAVFALSAYGLALVWGVMNVKNLAQGDFVIFGGYLAWWLQKTFGIHPIFMMPVVMALLFIFGWIMYVLIIRWVIDRDLFTSLLATFGIAFVLQQLLNLAFGPEIQTANSGMQTRTLFSTVSVAEIKVVSFILCCILAALIVAFMKRSRMGQAIRATAQDPRAARIMGIDTERVYAFTYALNAAICGAAGVLIAMIWVIQPFYGITHSIRSFVIVTAAGLGNLPGVIVSALGLGVIEQFGGFVLGAEFQQVAVVGMLLIVLIWRQHQMRKLRQVVQ
ncbi:MAG: branched-chain amino acid ABC transporter permease [Rhodospirillales bacterium]|jgi:branched-chain amino acid transport system permease protein